MNNDISNRALPATATGGRLDGDILRHLGQHLSDAFACPGAADTPPAWADLLRQLAAALEGAHDAPPAAQNLRDALLGSVPALRAFAFSLTHDPDRSDDLVQDTLVRAWAKADTFTPGTNLTAWLFTILRNLFYSEQRKRKREVEDADGKRAETLVALPDQHAYLDLSDFRIALKSLSRSQQEALMLIGAHGLSYDDAAAICGVAVGTVKSRVNRARTRLVEMLGMAGTDDIGADPVTRAALGAG